MANVYLSFMCQKQRSIATLMYKLPSIVYINISTLLLRQLHKQNQISCYISQFLCTKRTHTHTAQHS